MVKLNVSEKCLLITTLLMSSSNAISARTTLLCICMFLRLYKGNSSIQLFFVCLIQKRWQCISKCWTSFIHRLIYGNVMLFNDVFHLQHKALPIKSKEIKLLLYLNVFLLTSY